VNSDRSLWLAILGFFCGAFSLGWVLGQTISKNISCPKVQIDVHEVMKQQGDK